MTLILYAIKLRLNKAIICLTFKGTIARDFQTLVVFIYRYHHPIGPRFTPGKSFDFGRNFAEIFPKTDFLYRKIDFLESKLFSGGIYAESNYFQVSSPGK